MSDKPTYISSDTPSAIGIDLGGTTLKYAVVFDNGGILWQDSTGSGARQSKAKVLDNIVGAVKTAQEAAAAQSVQPAVVGIGAPGCIDIDTGTVLGAGKNIPDWTGTNIAEEVSSRTGLPVFVDNDANCMGLAEKMWGAGRIFGDFLAITVGTGIGGAIIIDGKLHRGFRSSAGEFGAMVIRMKGRHCSNEVAGSLECYASSGALRNRYLKLRRDDGMPPPTEHIGVNYINRMLLEGDENALRAVNDVGYAIGSGIASLLNLFNPQAVIIGGGVIEAIPELLKICRKTAFSLTVDACAQQVQVLRAELGNHAGFLGAAAFALERMKIVKSVSQT